MGGKQYSAVRSMVRGCLLCSATCSSFPPMQKLICESFSPCKIFLLIQTFLPCIVAKNVLLCLNSVFPMQNALQTFFFFFFFLEKVIADLSKSKPWCILGPYIGHPATATSPLKCLQQRISNTLESSANVFYNYYNYAKKILHTL